MRILQFIPGKIWGGAEQYVLDLSKAVMKQGHEVRFVTRKSEPVEKRLKSEEMGFAAFPFTSWMDFRSIRGLAKEIKNFNPDVIHVHNTRSVPIAWFAKKLSGMTPSIVMTRHESRKTGVNPLFRGIFRKLDHIIFVSDFTRKSWGSANNWIDYAKTSVIINSIPDRENTDKEKDVYSIKEKYGIGSDVPLLMYTGRVRKSKGCALIIEALGKLKALPWKLVYVGACKPADYDAKLLALAAKYGIEDRIHFEGYVSNARDFLAQADLGVAPSIVVDSCPLSPLEFMKEGKCVVVSDSGGQPEYVIDGETGLIARKGDVDSLVEKLGFALSNRDARMEIGERGETYFKEHLGYDVFVRKTLDAYQKAIESDSGY